MESSSRNSNNGQLAGRYIMDDNGIMRNVEPLEMIQESTEYSSSSRPPPTRGTRPSMVWPFHHSRSGNSRSGHSRSGSEAASTTFSTFSNFRWANWQHRSFLRMTPDDATSVTRSIVPDYIVNYMRGETPETLALKREQREHRGERQAALTPAQGSHASFPVEFGNYYSSSTDLTRGLNGLSGSNSRHSGFRRHFAGWRGGVVFNTLISFIILVVDIILLIIVLTRTKLLAGESAVWSGDCGKAQRINIGLHVVINVFGTVLLAGANYVFQVLSSPTRREVDKAHESKRWLDIGVTSVRNFAHISGFRSIVGTIVLFAAIAIQVIYNAVIYVTQGGTETETETTNTCSININGPMFGIVMLLNLALILGTATILVRSTFQPLVTIGDALRSFLREPDHTTAGACLLTKDDVKRGRWGATREQPMAFVPQTHLWLHTPSATRWLLTALAWVAACGPAAAGLALLLIRPSDNDTATGDEPTTTTTAALSALFPVFGTPYASFPSPSQPTASTRSRIDDAAVRTALIAALPQVVLAVLYLAVNALLTTYFLGQEYAMFAAGVIPKTSRDEFAPMPRLQPRPLRVSSTPAGQQVTSLYLTLPRPVSWVLLIAFAALGFLASMAVAPVVYMNNNNNNTTSSNNDNSPPSSPPSQSQQQQQPTVSLTLNTTALLSLLAILAFLLLFALALGLRSAPPAPLVNGYDEKRGREVRGNPLAQALRGGSCSAVVSAACHAPRGEYGSARGCVAWGVVADRVAPTRPPLQPPRRNSQPLSLSRRVGTPLSPFSPAMMMMTTTMQTQTPTPSTPGTPSPFISYNDGLLDGEVGGGGGGGDAMVGRCAFSGNVHLVDPAMAPVEGGLGVGDVPVYASPSAGLGYVDLERRYA